MTIEQEEVIFLLQQKLDEYEKEGLIISRELVEQAIEDIKY